MLQRQNALSIITRAAIIGILLVAVSGCAGQLINEPINQPITQATAGSGVDGPAMDAEVGDVVIALSFSGGGTRAAAFAHGVMLELANTPIVWRNSNSNMLQQVRFVTGVSGGSVAAAYFGLKGQDAIHDFRERFLIRNAEESLSTSINPINIRRIFTGGVNDATGFSRWLDKNLFEGAKFRDFGGPGKPFVFINASDIFNRIPFVFDPATFSAICSDLSSYPVASAVGASAAVPIAFVPEVLQTYPHACTQPLPDWVKQAHNDDNAPASLKSYAAALHRFRNGEIPYIKLVDGGATDNFGLYAFLIARQGATTPYGPITQKDAVRLREFVLIVVNAGRGPSGDWINSVEGPSGRDLLMAVSDTMIESSVRGSIDSLGAEMAAWQKELINYRCSLPRAKVLELRGTLKGWRCRDIAIRISEINFDLLDDATHKELDQIPTRFNLLKNQVDLVIQSGRRALVRSQAYRDLLKRFGIPVPAI
ncbi:MAG: patatin-like phospholipase family protein [Fimbriimonadaceae bacterium]|nr:patatin-like phospholipase family protein [Alphaproteobacteria bacterium]